MGHPTRTVTRLVTEMTDFVITPDSVPRALAWADTSRISSLLAVDFFTATLDDHGTDGLRYTRFLTPDYLLKHEPNVLSVEVILSGDTKYPPGQFYERRDSVPEGEQSD